MAARNPLVTQEEKDMVRRILARLEAQGEGLSPRQVLTPNMTAGSMSDASKRLRGSSPSSDDGDNVSGFSVVHATPSKHPTGSKQEPVPPRASKKIDLPAGVESLEQWGKTVRTMPKVKKEAPTYHEIATWESYEEYRDWVLSHGTSKGPVCLDLHNYLRACGCAATITGEKYPDSNVVRKYRE